RQHRLPLAAVTGVESVKVIEAHARRPLIEWTRLARLERRRVVILSPPTCAIAVLLQYLADRGILRSHDAVVAGEAGRDFGDHTEANRVVVAPREQRPAGGRTQRRGMEIGVSAGPRQRFCPGWVLG